MADKPERDVVSDERKGQIAARITQIVDYVFFVIYAIIAVEILLELAGARDRNAFKQFMDGISSPFLSPFDGLFRDPAFGEYHVMYSYIAALIIWALVHVAIRRLIRVLAPRASA